MRISQFGLYPNLQRSRNRHKLFDNPQITISCIIKSYTYLYHNMAQNVIIKRKQNQVDLGGGYGYADIQMNNREIYDFIQALKTNRLSQASILKVQHLNRQFLMYRTLMMGISVPTAWYLAGWLLVNPRKSWTRYRVIMTVPLAFPIAALLRVIPIKRRITTDLVTQDGEDGPYIRQALRKWKPGLWTKISRQLFHLGYEFPEMNELKDSVQFPVGNYSIRE